MNTTVKTVALTLIALSLFTIAMIEVSGISTNALFNKSKSKLAEKKRLTDAEQMSLDSLVNTMPKTTFKVSDTLVDLGDMVEGEARTACYTISNTGDNDLKISNVITSCGCTASDFPKHNIKPGKSAAIILEFDSRGKSGPVTKSALIRCNADNAPYAIKFSTNVLKDTL